MLSMALLNLPAIKGFSSIQHLLKPHQRDSPSMPNAADNAEETGDSPLQEPLLAVEGGSAPRTPPQGPARPLALDIGGALLEPSVATRNFAAFSRSVELELLGKAQGRGACNPVVHRPVLRDDRHASRWHERPTALLSQIGRLAKGLVASQPPPAELLDLALQYLSEEKQAAAPTPEWGCCTGAGWWRCPCHQTRPHPRASDVHRHGHPAGEQPLQAQGQPTQQGELLQVA